MDSLVKAHALKEVLDKLRPLSTDQEQRIMQKFRLDWNYHSNHLEGNSLTFGETKALILYGITAQGKPLKDHFEIRGHNEAIRWIEDIVKSERPLNETFIRELHQLLLKEPYQVDAITPEGAPTKKWVYVGVYKSTPNHVKTATGEIFRFATPEETPAMMHDLLNWYNSEQEKKDLDPILFAAAFHYQFIRIHPFDDGNGRTARILMNFILMKFGYPPVIIKTQDKQQYFSALQQADAGIMQPFQSFIADNLTQSLDIMIKGAKGESIEEVNDIDKELALLKMQFTNVGKRYEIVKSDESIKVFIQGQFRMISDAFEEAVSSFDDFFVVKAYSIYFDSYNFKTPPTESIDKIVKYVHGGSNYIQVTATQSEMRYLSLEKFSVGFALDFNFSRQLVEVKCAGFSKMYLYDEEIQKEDLQLLKTEIKKEGKAFLEKVFKENQIKEDGSI